RTRGPNIWCSRSTTTSATRAKYNERSRRGRTSRPKSFRAPVTSSRGAPTGWSTRPLHSSRRCREAEPLDRERCGCHPVTREERHPARERGLPCGQVQCEVRAVAVLVRVLELVEGVVFVVEELALPAEEMVVDRAADNDSRCAFRLVVRFEHQHPLAWAGPTPAPCAHGSRGS